MSDEKKTTPTETKTDDELSDLLDSALSDFSKAEPSTAEPPTATAPEAPPTDVEWSNEFIKQAAQQFESNMSGFLRDMDGSGTITGEQLQQSFLKMAEAASKVIDNPGEETEDTALFASTISQTLQSLNEGTESAQNPIGDAELRGLLGGGGGGDQNEFLPFMQGMMQSLLSKEVLYPSLKEILDKYPDWLTANEATLTSDDSTRYKKQQEVMEQVCAQLEKESDVDTPEQKREHFERVLSLMQKLQDFGQPPSELVGPGFQQLDQDAAIDPNNCCVT